jgi:glycerol-3-phosphate acyltransferase PlsX
MAGATMFLGRLSHVTRPAAAIVIPNTTGYSLLLDAGASTDCTPSDILNFAVMGAKYVQTVWNLDKPRVGLLSIGEEEIKGTKTARSAHQVLKESGINFIGNVQGNDLSNSVADVIVTDGFTGNVALKVAEGFATLMEKIVKDEIKHASLNERIAAWVIYPMLKRIKKRFDWQEYGGGSLLGVNGNVVIAHGKSGRRAIASAARLLNDLGKTNLVRNLEESLIAFHSRDTMDKGEVPCGIGNNSAGETAEGGI